MNQIFEPKRFGRYLAADLRHAKARYGVTFLALSILPLLPMLLNLIVELLGWCFGYGRANLHRAYDGSEFAYLGAIILTVSLPVSLYGHFTDRLKGPRFILLPASSLEKFLSCVLVTCIIVPGALMAAYIVDQTILSLIGYGNFRFLEHTDRELFGNIRLMFTALPTLLLGALCFKRHKLVKTFGATILLAIAVALIALIVYIVSQSGSSWTDVYVYDDGGLIKPYFVVYQLAVLVAIYLKIRKIQY